MQICKCKNAKMQKSEQREPSKLDWGWPSRVDFSPKVKNANLQNIQHLPGTDNPEYCNIALHLVFSSNRAELYK